MGDTISTSTSLEKSIEPPPNIIDTNTVLIIDRIAFN